MHLIFGLTKGNAQAAERLNSERYPRRDAPDCWMFVNWHHNLCQYGSLGDNSNNDESLNDCCDAGLFPNALLNNASKRRMKTFPTMICYAHLSK
ncbi:hypothetical protein TNCV_4710851 [Trichonephila clavipes]|uniref:Uncharacterized protein n=1 Tax=Trichonephila clavipes TaxID=2585209 RepID=A0A8X6RW81_TRICX|nr:hypothetical protein TNCV_4710851 [Trichonephila clavipes]